MKSKVSLKLRGYSVRLVEYHYFYPEDNWHRLKAPTAQLAVKKYIEEKYQEPSQISRIEDSLVQNTKIMIMGIPDKIRWHGWDFYAVEFTEELKFNYPFERLISKLIRRNRWRLSNLKWEWDNGRLQNLRKMLHQPRWSMSRDRYS